MTLSLLLPWFPILLGAGLGGRLLGRPRGTALGALCALFWVVLVQATAGVGVWRDGWAAATIAAGAIAIVAIAAWSAEVGGVERLVERSEAGSSAPEISPGNGPMSRIVAIFDHFYDFLDQHRLDADPWPEFDEFIRRSLYELCRATHVRPYRLSAEGTELAPLLDGGVLMAPARIPATDGVVGEVLRTGRAFRAMAPDVATGDAGRTAGPAWCFAIRVGMQRAGIVSVGHVDLPAETQATLLPVAERMVSAFWQTLVEAARSRSAKLLDPATGVQTREAFLAAAEQAISDSYAQSEPVGMLVIALEGIRDLNDSARWELADEMLHEAGAVLRRKLRMDDRVGRFDGSRFLVLLRRVDAELANLISGQIVSRLTVLCGDRSRWRTSIVVRGGLVVTGATSPGLRDLVARALALGHEARVNKTNLAADTFDPHEATVANA